MMYPREPLLNIPVCCELPVYVIAILAWTAIWVVGCAVVFWRLAGQSPSHCAGIAAGYIMYAAFGIIACRSMFAYLPMRAIYVPLLIPLLAGGIALLVLRLLLGVGVRRSLRAILVGIPTLCIPIFLFTYIYTLDTENRRICHAESGLRQLHRLLTQHKEATGHYPPQQRWLEALSPQLVREHQWGRHEIEYRIAHSGWRFFTYVEPGRSPGSNAVCAYTDIGPGEILPKHRVTLDVAGHVEHLPLR